MGKSSTTLRAEIYALQANDPSGITQEYLRTILHTIQVCNSTESLDAMQSVIDVVLLDFLQVEALNAPRSSTALSADMSNDVTGLTQGFKRIVLRTYERINKDVSSDQAIMFEAALITLTAEISAKKA